jgi:dTDP-4-dehydrorhamnose 3,5-epimerase
MLPGILLIEPSVHEDDRGSFMELYRYSRYAEFGIGESFVQDNVSFSRRGVLRGLHYQKPNAQGKLVTVLAGEVFDVAVDIRAGSPTFGKWVGYELSAQNKWQLWIPAGFAHGLCITSDTALFMYKCTANYSPDDEHVIRWDDAEIGIQWPINDVILSARDENAPELKDVPRDALPVYAEAGP